MIRVLIHRLTDEHAAGVDARRDGPGHANGVEGRIRHVADERHSERVVGTNPVDQGPLSSKL